MVSLEEELGGSDPARQGPGRGAAEARHRDDDLDPGRLRLAAGGDRRSLRGRDLLQLQRLVGNRAASQLVPGATTTTVQRTKWEKKKGTWTAVPPPSGVNRWPHPDDLGFKPRDGDIYDQDTGELTSEGTTVHILDYVGETDKKVYGAWYPKDRARTAYSFTSGTGGQGPHTFPHIGKRGMGEASVRSRKGYDPKKIKARTGILPSPGQNRRLLRMYEENSGQVVDKKRKRELDTSYMKALDPKRRKKAKGNTAEAMELNVLATYAHGRKATDPELAAKGEKRDVAAPDLKALANWKKGDARPTLTAIDQEDFSQTGIFTKAGAHGIDTNYMDKYLRDIGSVARGDEDLSDLDLSSDDEYSD